MTHKVREFESHPFRSELGLIALAVCDLKVKLANMSNFTLPNDIQSFKVSSSILISFGGHPGHLTEDFCEMSLICKAAI
jgi:hypothetical protein